MTKKHPIEAHFEHQEAKQRVREAQQRQRQQARVEEQRRLDLVLQRLRQAWIEVSPSIATAVARANAALTPWVDERFAFAYAPAEGSATVSIGFLDDPPVETDIVADLTLDISSSTYSLRAAMRDDDVYFTSPSLSDADLDHFFGEIYKHATRDDEDADV
jgi:hypothetical protein